MRLDINQRSGKTITLSKGTSASALTGKVCPDLQKQKPKSLDTADVVRDVEKSRLQCAGLNRLEVEDESSLRERSSDPLGLESCAGYREVLSEA